MVYRSSSTRTDLSHLKACRSPCYVCGIITYFKVGIINAGANSGLANCIDCIGNQCIVSSTGGTYLEVDGEGFQCSMDQSTIDATQVCTIPYRSDFIFQVTEWMQINCTGQSGSLSCQATLPFLANVTTISLRMRSGFGGFEFESECVITSKLN